MDITVNSKKTLSEIAVQAKEVVVKNKVSKYQVVAVFDVSGSMQGMYDKGIVKALATRVLALGLELDDNGIIPVYALDDTCRKVADLTKANLETYVDKNLVDLVGGSTNYAPTINQIVADAEAGDPMLVLLFTDGENYDQEDAEEALVRASQLPIFFQWYGIYEGKNEPSFDFLHSMDEMEGRTVDNAGFSPLGLGIVHVSGQGTDSDQALMEDMVKEYKGFPSKAMMSGSNWTNLSKAHGVMKANKISGIIGQRFGRLVVLEESNKKDKYSSRFFLCACDCGNNKVVSLNNLKKGHHKSCGCLKREQLGKASLIHGMTNTRFYKIWEAMKRRSLNKNDSGYKKYGGRGITISDRWLDFEKFQEDMYDTYLEHVKIFGEKDTSIERKENNKGYFKENCRWATSEEQANNRRSSKFITYMGRTQTLSQWAKELGKSMKLLHGRLKKLSVEDAFTRPLRTTHRKSLV